MKADMKADLQVAPATDVRSRIGANFTVMPLTQTLAPQH
jgi:hypothetical protein